MVDSTFCPKCGTPRVGSFRYCRSCAFDFDTLPRAPIPTGPPSANPPPQRPTDPDKPPAIGPSQMWIVGGVLVLGAVAFFLLRSGDSSSTAQATSRPTERPAPTRQAATPPTDPLDQMALVFEGGHSRAVIKTVVDRVMGLYNRPIPDEYSNVGSAVLSVHQLMVDNGCDPDACSEMAILRCVADSGAEGLGFSLPEAMSICGVDLLEASR